MHFKWVGLLRLLLPSALAIISEKKFVLMPNHHVFQETSALIYENIESRIQCAALCRLKSCLSTDYVGQKCTLHIEVTLIDEVGRSYVSLGTVEMMLEEAGYVLHGGNRYINVVETGADARNTILDCQRPFTFGTRYMIVDESDMETVNTKYNEVFGADQEEKIFLGLTDTETEGTPLWDDGRDFIKYPIWKWKSGDGSNDDEHDIVFIKFMKEPRTWEAEYGKLDDSEKGVICEVTIPQELLLQ